MKKTALFIFLPLIVSMAAVFHETASDVHSKQKTLSDLVKEISIKFPVNTIVPEDLNKILPWEESGSYLLLDVRQKEEFEKSHIQHALHVKPSIKPEKFIKTFKDKFQGKKLVFYCSVGYRSSELLEKVCEIAIKNGAVSCANLKGGIFTWYNLGFPLYNASGETTEIHPYDEYWGKFVNMK